MIRSFLPGFRSDIYSLTALPGSWRVKRTSLATTTSYSDPYWTSDKK